MKKISTILAFMVLPFFLTAGNGDNKSFFDKVRMVLGGSRIDPLEMISRNVPAYTNDDCGGKTPAAMSNDPDYEGKWRGCAKPSKKKPLWLAYDLSGVAPGKRADILLVWYNEDTSPYDHTLITAVKNPGYNNPGDYFIELNAAPGGAVPEKGWLKFISVGNNTIHSGQHRIKMAGYNWIRFTADKSDGTKDNEGIAINMDIYDASKGTGDDWIFIGDSITQMAMNHNTFANPLGKGTFAELINSRNKKYFPAQENGGIGYMTSADGAKHIEKWLTIFPGKFVGLSYGTNDAWNCMTPKEFYNNYEIMVKAVLKAGKVPLVPRSIPWSSSQEKIRDCGAGLDAEIQKLFKAYPAIIKGPDFREYYRKNPKMLSQDGVHPSWPDGLFMYRKMWADIAIKNVYGN